VLIARLQDQVLEGPGELLASVRRAASAGDAVPEAAQAYVDKVRLHAYKVTDGDIEKLRADGWSEEAIFELTVAAALGAAMSRLEIARKAMRA
jgi:alkylhydroperoxidase family enzyme